MNIKQVARYTFLSLTLFTTLVSAGTKEPVDYVDMFIGTSNSRWMLGPYAQEPFGMVQLGRTTRETFGWADTNMPSTASPASVTCMPGRWAD